MRYEYIVADSIVPTFEFDVTSAETKEQVISGGAPSKPEMDFTLFPSGLGFKQEIDVVAGDTIDYVLKQTIKKKNIKITLMWKGSGAYYKYKTFLDWLARYNDLDKYRIRFSYELSQVRRFVDLSVIDLELKGRDDLVVSAELTAQPLSPFYEETVSSIMVNDTNRGKIYNYVYPYYYGGGAYSSSNVIENGYLKPIPLKITLRGPMENPFVNISEVNEDGSTGDVYGRVQFNMGLSIEKNESIVIDAFNNRIYKETVSSSTGAKTVEDLFNSVDKSYDSFLFAKSGKSKIAASLEDEASRCEVYYVRYTL